MQTYSQFIEGQWSIEKSSCTVPFHKHVCYQCLHILDLVKGSMHFNTIPTSLLRIHKLVFKELLHSLCIAINIWNFVSNVFVDKWL